MLQSVTSLSLLDHTVHAGEPSGDVVHIELFPSMVDR